MPGLPAPQPPQVQRLTAEDHRTQRELLRPRGILFFRQHELIERRWSLIERRDSLCCEQPQKLRGRACNVARHNYEPSALQQRAPDLPYREIEGVGMKQGPDVIRTKIKPRARGR